MFFITVMPGAVHITPPPPPPARFLSPVKPWVPFSNHHSQGHPIADKRFSALCPYLRNRFLVIALIARDNKSRTAHIGKH
jgi:hypothetical protein